MIHNSLATVEAKVNARMALGTIVVVDSNRFSSILTMIETPLVIVSREKYLFRKLYKYIVTYKGLVFYTDSEKSILLPDNIELIEAERIWTPT